MDIWHPLCPFLPFSFWTSRFSPPLLLIYNHYNRHWDAAGIPVIKCPQTFGCTVYLGRTNSGSQLNNNESCICQNWKLAKYIVTTQTLWSLFITLYFLSFATAGVPVTQPAAELGNGLPIADEWSGFSKTNNCLCLTLLLEANPNNVLLFSIVVRQYIQWTITISDGLGAVDTSSDWNAPTELWGNCDEPMPETLAAQETPVSQVPGVSQRILSTIAMGQQC